MQLNFLKKAKKNEILALTGLLCAVISVGYFFIFLSPVFAKLSDFSRKVSNLQSDLEIADLAIGSAPGIQKEIEEMRSKTAGYSNKLPKEEELPALLESLSMIAQNNDVKITKIAPTKDDETKPSSKKDKSIYQEKGISISAQCGYHQLGAFISEMENAERFMEISDITIENVKAAPKRHNVQLIVKTFVLKDTAK